MRDCDLCRAMYAKDYATAEGHCTGCGEHFTSDAAFDAHQTMARDSRGTVTCHDPAGLTGRRTLVRRDDGVWRAARPDERRRVGPEAVTTSGAGPDGDAPESSPLDGSRAA